MKTAFSATPPFFLRMFLVRKKGKKEALRTEKATLLLQKTGWEGEGTKNIL